MRVPLDQEGSYYEPDPQHDPANEPFLQSIVRITPLPGTRSGNRVTLACGHVCRTFGDLSRAQGKILCVRCREQDGR